MPRPPCGDMRSTCTRNHEWSIALIAKQCSGDCEGPVGFARGWPASHARSGNLPKIRDDIAGSGDHATHWDQLVDVWGIEISDDLCLHQIEWLCLQETQSCQCQASKTKMTGPRSRDMAYDYVSYTKTLLRVCLARLAGSKVCMQSNRICFKSKDMVGSLSNLYLQMPGARMSALSVLGSCHGIPPQMLVSDCQSWCFKFFCQRWSIFWLLSGSHWGKVDVPTTRTLSSNSVNEAIRCCASLSSSVVTSAG